jgi:hypothetical protein
MINYFSIGRKWFYFPEQSFLITTKGEKNLQTKKRKSTFSFPSLSHPNYMKYVQTEQHSFGHK